jgi:hypothetical protein
VAESSRHNPAIGMMPQIMPREVLDVGNLERGVKRVLDVLHGLTGLASVACANT